MSTCTILAESFQCLSLYSIQLLQIASLGTKYQKVLLLHQKRDSLDKLLHYYSNHQFRRLILSSHQTLSKYCIDNQACNYLHTSQMMGILLLKEWMGNLCESNCIKLLSLLLYQWLLYRSNCLTWLLLKPSLFCESL